MKIYILSSAAVLTLDGRPEYPEIRTKVFLSALEAQLEMAEEFDREEAEAKANGHKIAAANAGRTGANLTYGNDSMTDIVWDIEEKDVPMLNASFVTEDCVKRLKELVKTYGKPNAGKTVLLFPENHRPRVGGWLGDESEEADELVLDGDSLSVGTEFCERSIDELPCDDLAHILDEVTEDLELIKLCQQYFQPELVNTGDVPPDLASFQVFPTEEDCRKWMRRRGFKEGEYKVLSYSGEDIEEPTWLDGDGNVLYNSDLPR